MQLGGVVLGDGLLAGLVDAGRTAALIAQANLDEAGASSLLFGQERYLRSTELAVPVLVGAGYGTRRNGTGLVATGGGHELHFATAQGLDLRDPGTFDPDSSDSRRRAARINAGGTHPMLEGMPARDIELVIHVVWSATRELGLVAVHAGILLPSRGHRVDWAVLRPVFALGGAPTQHVSAAATPGYADQPEPELVLTARGSRAADEA